MLKLTKTQMQANLEDDHDFVQWYVHRFMRKQMAGFYFAFPDDLKEEMVRNGRSYAREFGFSLPNLQADFVTLMWIVGPGFFRHSPFSSILGRGRLEETEKMETLQSVSPEDFSRIARLRDETQWWPGEAPAYIHALHDGAFGADP